MKLFLSKLGSCWQSSHNHSNISDSRFDKSEIENALINPQPKRRSSSAHWRPALAAISEDNFVVSITDDVGRRRRKVSRQHRKSIRAPVKPNTYRTDLDSSWKVQTQIAIPAFSPAPFMF